VICTNKQDNYSIMVNQLVMHLVRFTSQDTQTNNLCHKKTDLIVPTQYEYLLLPKRPPESYFTTRRITEFVCQGELTENRDKSKLSIIRITYGTAVLFNGLGKTPPMHEVGNTFQDPRFNSEIDLRTGYKTNLILSMPICNYEGEVIGVAQIINKTNDTQEFTPHDVEVFQRYLTFCGIGIQNAQLFEMSVLEFRRNQILLNLARSIFEEQNNLECLVTKIMTEARELLKCERCAVFLLDTECCEASHLEKILERPNKIVPERKPLCRREGARVKILCTKFSQPMFELRAAAEEALVFRPKQEDLGKSRLVQIAKYVAATGQALPVTVQ
ncbi:hypothetical protein L9F63_021373, partial [Diploptera punctata]